MAISLTGMASGLDTESIICQLMQIEQTKVTAVQKRQVSVNQHKTDLQTIKSKLDAFKTAATDLGNASLWKAKQATTTSDPTKVEATVLGGAGIGGQSIQVDRLASSAQHGFNYTAGSAAGKIGFTSGSTTVAIDIAANATPADVAAAINGSDAAPVYAAVVGRRRRQARLLLAHHRPELGLHRRHLAAGAGTVLNEDTAYTRTGATLNASIKVNGGAEQNPESNVLETIIPGVRLTLKGITASPATVSTTSPAVDQDAITKKVTSLVEAYNAVVTFTRLELNEKKVPGAETSADLQKGQLSALQHDRHAAPLKTQMAQTLSGLGLTGLGDSGSHPEVHGWPDHPGRQGRQADARHRQAQQGDRRGLHEGPRPVRRRGRHQGLLGDADGVRGHADQLAGHDHRPDEHRTTTGSRASPIRSPSSTPVWRRSRSA